MSKRSSPPSASKPKRVVGQNAALTVASTGIVEGERVRVATQPGWCGSQFVLVRGFVPPATEELEAHVEEDPEGGRDLFFRRLLSAVRHRAGMNSVEAVRTWWEKEAVKTVKGGKKNDDIVYNYVTQAPGDLVVRMEAVAGTKPDDPSAIDADKLIALVGAEMSPSDVLMCFNASTDATADGHTRRLIFILQYWSLVVGESVEDQPLTAPVYLVSGVPDGLHYTQVQNLTLEQRSTLVPAVQDDSRVYIGVVNNNEPYDGDAMAFLRRFFGLEATETVRLAYKALCLLSLPDLKSLVQKIIRARPARVAFSDSVTVRAEDALALSILAALTMQTFNPHGGGIESGTLAMLKRVGVIIPVEDAWPECGCQVVLKMACLAVVASRQPNWKLSAGNLCELVTLARGALLSEKVVATQTVKNPPPCIPRQDTQTSGAAALVHATFLLEGFLGGMSGDKTMMRAAAANFRVEKRAALGDAVWTMPIYHCIDQHCATNIAYLFGPESLAAALIRDCKKHTEPMSDLFGVLFSKLTGLNPRRAQVDWLATPSELVQEFQVAQRDYWRGLTSPARVVVSESPLGAWDVTLPFGWLAYAVSTRHVEVNGVKWVWNINPDAPEDIRVARPNEKSRLKVGSPSVESPKEIAEEKQRAAVVERVRSILRQGIVVPAMYFGKDVRVRLCQDDSEYHVDGQPWESVRERKIHVPTGDWANDAECMDRDYAAKIVTRAVMAGVDVPGRRLAVSLLRSYRQEVVFPRPDRNGGAGRKGDSIPSAVQWSASCVWSALSRLCSLVVRRDTSNPARFTTPTELLPLRHMIAHALENREAPMILKGDMTAFETAQAIRSTLCDQFHGTVGKTLRAAQQHVFDRLVDRVVAQTPMRAHFVWLEVGAGKTFVALMFYKFLQELRKTKDFVCLFVTSSSALETVQMDARKLGMPVHCIRSSKEAAQAAKVKQGVIFACHDTIKQETELTVLLPLVGRALFVLDEAHLAMGSTIRKDGMKFLSQSASDLLVMTATPLRNSKEEGALRDWMQMAVSFPCTASRPAFEVALNSMLYHPLFDRVETRELLVQCGDGVAEVLQDIPRRMGGTSDAHQFSQEMARRSYAAACHTVDAHMVVLSRTQVEAGKNVWLVCEDAAHMERMQEALLTGGVCSHAQLWRYNSSAGPIRSMPAGGGLAYRVGLIPIRVSTGYSATHFNVRVRGVYRSNEADRTQIDGRIARYGQTVSPVEMFTVHAGITTLMVNNHINAANFTRMAKQLNE